MAAALVTALLTCVAGGPAYALDVGAHIPRITMIDSAGNFINGDRLRGQVRIIHFWSDRDPDTVANLSTLDALHGARGARGLTVIGYATDPASAGRFTAQHHFSIPLVFQYDGDVLTQFQPTTRAATYVFDRRGVLRSLLPGLLSSAPLRAQVDELLSETGSD